MLYEVAVSIFYSARIHFRHSKLFSDRVAFKHLYLSPLVLLLNSCLELRHSLLACEGSKTCHDGFWWQTCNETSGSSPWLVLKALT